MSVTILNGDALAMLRTLDSESVQVCVTSPPYLNLRSYLPEGHPDKDREIGLHETADDFIAALVMVFREVKRVLRNDGVCFVNLGFSYAGSGRGPTGANGIGDQSKRQGFDSGEEIGKVGRVGLMDGDQPYALRDDLTPDEMAYVFAELAASFGQGNEVGLPVVSVGVDP